MYWYWKKIPILINEFNLYSPKFGKISILYLLCANLCPSKKNTFEVWLNVAVQGQSVKRVTWNSDIFFRVEIVPPQIRAQVILSLKYLQPKLDRIYFTEN